MDKEKIYLWVLFLLVFSIKLSLTWSQTYFDTDSYFLLRQASIIKETGLPAYNDELSYSGRFYLFPPLMHYLLAGASFFFELETAAKILIAILSSAIVIPIFLISRHITKNFAAAMAGAIFAGAVSLSSLGNLITTSSLSLFLVFLLSYYFLKIEDGYAIHSIVAAILLLLTDQIIMVFLLSLVVFYGMGFLEKHKPTHKEIELTIFLIFLALWFNALVYKKAFVVNGLSVFWNNLPTQLLGVNANIGFLAILSSVGFLTVLLGLAAIYYIFFGEKNKNATLYVSLSFVSFMLVWSGVASSKTGLMLLIFSMIILSAYMIKVIQVQISKTKFDRYSNYAVAVLVVLFIALNIPSFSAKGFQNQNDIAALKYIKENTPGDSVVLSRIDEGFLVNYFASRKNVGDTNFLFIKNVNKVYDDIDQIYHQRLKSEAIRLINEYGIDYIFLSTKTAESGITSLFYADADCFELVYDVEAKVYKNLGCEIQ